MHNQRNVVTNPDLKIDARVDVATHVAATLKPPGLRAFVSHDGGLLRERLFTEERILPGVSRMIYQSIKVVVVVATLAVCGNASAQDCVGCNQGGVTNYDYVGAFEADKHRCGRGITQARAAALWAGYCNENCDTGGRERRCRSGCFGKRHAADCGCETTVVNECDTCNTGGGGCGGCKLGGRLRGKLGGGCGAGGGAACCNSGGFGYPTACCDDPCASPAGCGGKIFGGRMGHRHACGGCGLFGRHRCGDSGAYFDECGCESGNAPMQSCVEGTIMNSVEPTADAPKPVVGDAPATEGK